MPEESKKRAATVDKPDDTLRASSLFDWRGRGGIALASGHVVSGGGGNEPSDSGSDVGGCQSSESDEDEDATTKLPGSGTDCTVIADFREGKSETYQMPSNVELLNTDHVQLDEQEDGAMALHLPDGAFLKLKLPKPVLRGWGGLGGWGNLGGWGIGAAKDDGLVRTYSIMLCLRVDALPKLPLALFSGAMPRPGETLEHVSVYKNGGVLTTALTPPRTARTTPSAPSTAHNLAVLLPAPRSPARGSSSRMRR